MSVSVAPPRAAAPPLVGNSIEMARDPAAFFLRCYRRYGPVYRVRVFGREQTVLAGPEAALFLGSAEGRDSLRSREFWQGLVQEYGATRTLTGMDGPEHQELRRVMRRGYSRQALAGRHEELVRITRAALDRDWPEGGSVRVVPALQYLVVDQLGTLLTGSAPREYVEDIRLAITYILNVLVTRQRPRALLADPRYLRAKRRIDELGRRMAAEWRANGPLDPAHPSLIDDVMRTNTERPDLIPDQDLVLTLTGPYVAGLDTVANTLAATVYGVLRHPEVHLRVTMEAREVLSREPSDAAFTTDAPAISGAIQEAMRLYPIAVAQMRTATRDFDFAGHTVRAGQTVYVATSVPHFMAEFFPEPKRFDIDRYSPGRAEHKAPGAYSPYGRGPHLCLGKSLAEVQMGLTIATLFGNRFLQLPSPDYRLPRKTAPVPGPARRFRVRVLTSR